MFALVVATTASTAVFSQTAPLAGPEQKAGVASKDLPPPKNPSEQVVPSPSVANPTNAVGSATTVSPATGGPAQQNANGKSDPGTTKKKYDPGKNCVDLSDEAIELESGRRPVGPPIIFENSYLPGNSFVDVGLDKQFVEGIRYFAYIHRDRAHRLVLSRSNVVTRKSADSDPLVKKGLLDKDQTIVSLYIANSVAGFWNRADLYLYTCGTDGSPAQVSRAPTRISSSILSNFVAIVAVVIAYGCAAFAWRKGAFGWSSLNPVKITAGIDGKGSLAKFQIGFFSLIVFGLIVLFLLCTGVLSELSSTLLMLLGISGLGSTVAKTTDAQRSTLSPENRAWLLQRGWLPDMKTNSVVPAWRDFFTTDGEFDIYRYQSFLFSLVVGAAMVLGGIAQLSSFSIPETLLGVLGLSQAVYIGGKLVTPTNMADLNKQLGDLRDQERQFRNAARSANAGNQLVDLTQATTLAGQEKYSSYVDKARDVAALFSAQTGLVVDEAGLKPSII